MLGSKQKSETVPSVTLKKALPGTKVVLLWGQAAESFMVLVSIFISITRTRHSEMKLLSFPLGPRANILTQQGIFLTATEYKII